MPASNNMGNIGGMIVGLATANGLSVAINAQANSVKADCELIDGVELEESDLREVRKMRAIMNGLPTNFSGSIFGSMSS